MGLVLRRYLVLFACPSPVHHILSITGTTRRVMATGRITVPRIA